MPAELFSDWLRDKRRYVAVAAATYAAVMTPPDVVSQLALAVPCYLALEVFIAVIAWMESARR